jgi:hypothetical protein
VSHCVIKYCALKAILGVCVCGDTAPFINLAASMSYVQCVCVYIYIYIYIYIWISLFVLGLIGNKCKTFNVPFQWVVKR